MKFLKYFFCLLAGFGALACNNDNEGTNVETGAAAPIKISIVADQSRATGNMTDVEAVESKVNDLTVFVFNGGQIDGYVIGEATTDNSVEITNTTAGARDFIVIANAPAGVFTASMTKAQVEAAVMTLPSTQESDELVMVGTLANQTLNPAASASENPVDVRVSRLAARVALTSITIDLDDQAYPTGKIEITSVCMNNVNVKYNVKGDAAKELKDFGDTGTEGWGETFAQPITTIDPTAVPYFYVAPNVVVVGGGEDENEVWSAQGTEMVIYGKYYAYDGATAEEVNYPVKINREMPGTVIEGSSTGIKGGGVRANTKYNISVKIKAPGQGEQYPAPCEVTVTVEDWLWVNQSVEF